MLGAERRALISSVAVAAYSALRLCRFADSSRGAGAGIGRHWLPSFRCASSTWRLGRLTGVEAASSDKRSESA